MPLSTAHQMGAIRWIAAGGLSILLLLMWTSQFTERAVNDDAAQSVRMGYNLAHHGVISVDRTAPFLVTNYREPFPAWVHALSMSAMESVMGRVPIEAYDSGPRLKYLKWENVFWLGMLSVVAFLSVRGLTGSFWFALAAVVCLNVTFRPYASGGSVDDLMTEIPASAVLVAASFVLSVAFMRGTVRHFVARRSALRSIGAHQSGRAVCVHGCSNAAAGGGSADPAAVRGCRHRPYTGSRSRLRMRCRSMGLPQSRAARHDPNHSKGRRRFV